MHVCDFCGVEKETFDSVDGQIVSNFAQISIAGPHQGKYICSTCYKNLLPIDIYSACYVALADGRHEGFVMNHSFASEEPTYIVAARGLEYDGIPQEYVLLTEIPAELVSLRDDEIIPDDLRQEWEAAMAEAGAH